MKAWVVAIIVVILLGASAAALMGETTQKIKNEKNRISVGNGMKSSRDPYLNPNGSFPYNFQAFPLYEITKDTSSAVGDVNGDGFPDAVFASFIGSNVSIHLNGHGWLNVTPDGILNSSYGIFHPTDVVVVDGLIAVTCHNGTSTFTTDNERILIYNVSDVSKHLTLLPPTLSSGVGSVILNAMAVGDFNGDGEDDIAASYSSGDPSRRSDVSIYYGPFSDGQTPNVNRNVQGATFRMISGDFNDDNFDDLAVTVLTDSGNGVWVYHGNSNGIGQNPDVKIEVNHPAYIASGYINHDSYSDLAISNNYTGNISIYTGSSTGLAASPTLNLSAGAGVQAIAIGRFDSKIGVDVIASYRNKNLGWVEYPFYMSLFSGPLHDGEKPSEHLYAGSGIRDLHVVDFNGDGEDDLLVGAFGGNGDSPSLPYVLYQRDHHLNGISDLALYGGIYPTGVAIMDINNDGLNDLAVADTILNKTDIYVNMGYGLAHAYQYNFTVYGYPLLIASGNLDDDPTPDLAITHVDNENVTLYMDNGMKTLNLTTNLNTTFQVSIGDIDGNGTGDVIVSSTNTSAIDIFYGEGGFTAGEGPNKTLRLPSPARDFSIINISGADYPGLAVLLVDRLIIYNQTSPGNFEVYKAFPVSSGELTSCSVGDFNGDGADDIIITGVVNDFESYYSVILQNNGSFGVGYGDSLPGGVYDVETGDFNDDGYSDFAVTTTLGLCVIGYYSYYGFHYDYLATDANPSIIAAGDITGDGKDDIATTTHGPDSDAVPLEINMVDVYYQKDTPPIANITAPSSIYEGNYINLSAENSTDTLSDENSLNYTWFVWNGTGWELIGYDVNITYFASTQGTYNFTLKVTDKEGLYSYDTASVEVMDTVPHGNITHTIPVVEGENATFTANISAYDGIYAIYWDMNSDGVVDFENQTVVSYAYPSQGTYYVNLTVVDGDKSVVYLNETVVVEDSSPTCSFTYSPTAIYEGEKVNFIASADSYDPVVNWTWRFGTAIMYGKNINYTFPQDGSYTVNLTVTDSDGSKGWSKSTVIVMDTFPQVNFTWNGTYEGEQFQFYANVSSYDSISSYYWDFGDGNHSNSKNPTHVYGTQGSYLVTLYVEDSDGSNVSYSHLVNVEDQKPSVSFTYTNPVEGEEVQFTANVHSYDGITSITWSFGDGGTSNNLNPAHVYVRNGTYTVTVTVYEADGDSAKSTQQIFVEDTSPVISLRIDGSRTVVEDENVHVNASGTVAYDGIREYLWDFNYQNGRFSSDLQTTEPYAVTSYPEMGEYTIAVMVVDGDGSASISYVQIEVNNVDPVANFTYVINENELRVDASSTYDTPSDKELLNYTWDFGDGSRGYGEIVTHHYTKPGNYTVVLTVVDNDGAVSRVTKDVKISTIPQELPANRNGASTWLILILLLALIGAIIAVLLAMKKNRYMVDDVYLIHESGILIHHATRRLKPEMDEDILSSMLIAVQEFIKDAFKGEDNVALKSMDFGDKKIQIHKGKNLFLAIVSSTDIPKNMARKAQDILREIEEKYRDVLENWDGEVSAFRGVGEILKKIWE